MALLSDLFSLIIFQPLVGQFD